MEKTGRPTWRMVLDGLATVAFIGVCGTLMWVLIADRRPVARSVAAAAPPPRPRQELPPPAEPISLDGAPVQGSTSARIALIE